MYSPTAVLYLGRPITRRPNGVKLISEKAKYFPPGFFKTSDQQITAENTPFKESSTKKQEEALRRAREFITE
jgi:hypothetical protein